MASSAERLDESSGVAAREQAIAWLIALRENPNDDALQARFAVWHDADAAHVTAWAEASHSYDGLGAALRAQRARRHRPRRTLMAGAVMALAAGLAVIAGPSLVLSLRADYRTAAAEIREVTLADGSLVVLAPQSSIAVHKDDETRGVKLLSGRAFFDVKPDAGRPFEVEANSAKVTVLGTAFEVKTSATGATVSVQHGRVRVAAGSLSKSTVLEAGDWLQVEPDGATRAGAGAPDQFAAWKTGQLFVIDQSVAAVVDEFRPYFSGVIVLAEQNLGAQRVTGIYNLQRPLEGLRGLSKAYPGVTVWQVSPWLIVISRL